MTAIGHMTALYWTLRVAVAMCYVGHGAFGVITKEGWLRYFAVAGIPPDAAWRLMPLVGVHDIAIGVMVLLAPTRFVLSWAAFWGIWTALLRPLSGEPFWETLERAGNYGVPLALLYCSERTRTRLEWFLKPVGMAPLTPFGLDRLAYILRLATGFLLIGHGAFGLVMQKAEWVGYVGVVGIGPTWSLPAMILVGTFEIAVGFAVVAWEPAAGFALFVAVWKIGTELLRPLAGEPWWEWIERGGSYGAPLALFFLLSWRTASTWRGRRLERSLDGSGPERGIT